MDEKILWALCTRHGAREEIVKAFDGMRIGADFSNTDIASH